MERSRALIRSGAAALAISTAAAQAAPHIEPLADVRARLEVPAYSAAERRLLAEQAHFVIEQLYVHRDLKIADFGVQHDPLPRLEQVRSNAASLSPAALHDAVSAAFTDLHDLHTNYVAPAPLACATSFIPLRFESVRDGDTDLVVISGRMSVRPEMVAGLSTGMRLVSIDGRDVEDVLAELSQVSGGANPAAMRARAVQMLSMQSHATRALPAADTRRFEFRGSGGVEVRDLPWLVAYEDSCLEGRANRRLQPFALAMTMAEDDYQKRYNQLFGVPELRGEPPSGHAMRRAASPLDEVFTINLLQTPAGRLGYIKLKAFYWEDESLDLATVVESFRRAVETDLAGAVGLVIDVRGNPGGVIVMAEKLVQLFAPGGVEPTTVRMLANELNEEIFRRANGGENRWSAAVRTARAAGQRYTAPLAITPVSEANSLGQIWFAPVVVLTDATCYSACDVFAAGMQDNGAATVLGIHAATGAGGANVMEYATFRAIFDDAADNPFVPLPHAQGMRVSWRQIVRAGQSAGGLLEDSGVRPDVVVPLRLVDIGTESRELMRQIHRHIDAMRPRHTSGLGLKQGGIVTLPNATAARWSEEVYGIDTLEVRDGEQLLQRLSMPLQATPDALDIALDGVAGSWHDRRVALVGFAGGRQVLRAVRELRWRGAYTSIPSEGLRIDFDGEGPSPLRLIRVKGPADASWQILDGRLRVGSGPTYPSSTLVRALLPLQLDGAGGTVRFDLEVDAEELHDSLRIYAVDPDSGERYEYFAGSKVPEVHDVSLELPRGWSKVDLVFEFESDENWSLAGPSLDNLRVKR
jgi:C-terminal processing protease CtpA/Prc